MWRSALLNVVGRGYGDKSQTQKVPLLVEARFDLQPLLARFSQLPRDLADVLPYLANVFVRQPSNDKGHQPA